MFAVIAVINVEIILLFTEFYETNESGNWFNWHVITDSNDVLINQLIISIKLYSKTDGHTEHTDLQTTRCYSYFQ